MFQMGGVGPMLGQAHHFLHFNPDYEIRTLPGCVDADHPDRYPEPITADGYLRQRLKEIKLL